MNAVEDSLRSPQSLQAGSAGAGSQPAQATPAPESATGRAIAGLLSRFGNPPFEIVLWDGERVTPPRADIVARMRIKDAGMLFALVRNPDLQFGDAYSDGRIDLEGDLVAFMEEVYRGSYRARARGSVLGKLAQLLHRPRRNTLAGSKDNVHHHYDIGNDFYSLWLGSTMQYTCAYYPTSTTTLDAAQEAKMHHVCRKLRLRAGETVVEAGFGWGRLALHMARHYGVKVRAFNISKEQVAFARERARVEGLDSQVEYVEDDYRNIAGRFDAFVSVGMLEHVGVENYRELGKVASGVLGSNGRGLIHSIGRNRPAGLHPWIERRIFPGANPPALSQMSQIFEPWDLSILDVENLRLHYARTLTDWLNLFESNAERVRSMFDEKFVRMWRLYLAGSVAAFTTGTLQLFQVVFAPHDNNDLPATRAYLYQG
ncbi:MAG TPA: cyclopropane-fatty-acyl-phospholipid synthase family protein [Steroidobacteraceae bacterium]|nr:cyclopropane-fatty-acyl-phospholipid synthase family protein [Steroidobacteraceae bacterium]